mgnify:CR=1 FL=1
MSNQDFKVGTYKYSSVEIKGYKTSSLAQEETNDCVVRAFATATEVGYNQAHEFVSQTFGRKKRQGTSFMDTTMMKLEETGMTVGSKAVKVRVLGIDEITNTYKLKGEIIKRKKTVKSFISSHPKGTYIVTVAGHAFTVKDGVLVDNQGEEFRPTRKVLSAFKLEPQNQNQAQLSLF